MKLYNSLTKAVETIQPLQPPKVTVYTCGPTVYDYPHIGNWFTFIRYDVLIRSLRAAGLQPKWVMNITDVGHLTSDADEGEDKLEKGAKREGKTAVAIAEYYSDYFIKSMKSLNFLQPDQLPRATQHITEQIDLIKQLEVKGFTYIIDDGVYYDTSKFADYGKLAQLDLAHQQAGARVAVNNQKHQPSDFALWKFSPDDQLRDMEWDSPWGKGFPGWHLECSAMSMKYLGPTIDIHAGGIDHLPVHHTNEIAQSEAATGQPYVRHWLHANHILIEAQKVSKSLGNGLTLEDIQAKGFTPMDLRLLVLESHYRTQSHFSWDALSSAQSRLRRWQSLADLRWQPKPNIDTRSPGLQQIDERQPQLFITQQLSNDLNSPEAITWLDRLADVITALPNNEMQLRHFKDFLHFVEYAFGIDLFKDDITTRQKTLIAEREKARMNNDWPLADKLRDQLANQQIGLRDTPHGPIWSRLN